MRRLESEALRDPRELRSYRCFKERTAPQLSGYFDREFWNVFVLQVAESSPVIKHALVAIGALHEALDISYSTWLHDQAEPLQLFALEQYNKSIALLTSKESAMPSIQVLLVSCIVFVTIQVMQRKRSIDLLQKGLHMLRLWQNSGGKHPTFSYLESTDGKLESEIVELLSRLGVNSSVFIPFSGAQMFGDLDRKAGDISMPDHFTSLHEARSYFDSFMACLFASVEGPRSREDVVSSAQIVNKFTAHLDHWWSAFQKCLASMGPMKDDAQCAALLLHIHYHIARIEVYTLPYRDQMLFDNHLDNFKAVVHFTGESLKIIKLSSDPSSAQAEDSMPRTTMNFGLEPGTMAALLWTALHCRDPRVRREAVGLLHTAHRREGALDSMTAAKVTSEMIGIEESYRSGPVQSHRDVPASARLVFLSGNFHGVDPEKGRPRAIDEEVLEARGKSNGGKDILRPTKRFKQLIPYPDNLMVCRYIKQPWKGDTDVEEIWLDLNDDIDLPGYTQLSPRYDWHPASRQKQEEIERLSEFYRDNVSAEETKARTAESTAMLKSELDGEQAAAASSEAEQSQKSEEKSDS